MIWIASDCIGALAPAACSVTICILSLAAFAALLAPDSAIEGTPFAPPLTTSAPTALAHHPRNAANPDGRISVHLVRNSGKTSIFGSFLYRFCATQLNLSRVLRRRPSRPSLRERLQKQPRLVAVELHSSAISVLRFMFGMPFAPTYS